MTLWFLSGTEPTEYCEKHSPNAVGQVLAIQRLEQELLGAGFGDEMFVYDDSPLSSNLEDEEQEELFVNFDEDFTTDKKQGQNDLFYEFDTTTAEQNESDLPSETEDESIDFNYLMD